VWELTLRTVTGLLRIFEQDMKADDFSLSWYDVLIQLAYAPEQRLRMQDLADAVILTRSGLTDAELSSLRRTMVKLGVIAAAPAAAAERPGDDGSR
jgi:DNA-binding MarR family transcriptional regulator